MVQPTVTFVICTYQRPDLLQMAVQSLQEQTAPADQFEVLVIDNEGQPNIKVSQIVTDAKAKPQIRYLHEPCVGLSYARNTGGKAAKSEYVGYLDDDAKASPEYVALALQIIKDVAPDFFGGPYYPYYLTPKPAWFRDKYGSGYNYGETQIFLDQSQPLTGSNILIRRALLDEAGWFSPNYGMKGDNQGYGEETELMMRAWQAFPDLQVYYHPRLFVYHFVAKFKMSLRWRIHWAYKMGWDQAYFKDRLELDQRQKPAVKDCFYTFFAIIKTILGIPFRNTVTYPYWQNYIYEVVARKVIALGSLARLLS